MSEITFSSLGQEAPVGALVAARGDLDRARIEPAPPALSVELEACDLRNVREQVALPPEQNARLRADWHAAICRAIEGPLTQVNSSAGSSPLSRRSDEQPA